MLVGSRVDDSSIDINAIGRSDTLLLKPLDEQTLGTLAIIGVISARLIALKVKLLALLPLKRVNSIKVRVCHPTRHQCHSRPTQMNPRRQSSRRNGDRDVHIRTQVKNPVKLSPAALLLMPLNKPVTLVRGIKADVIMRVMRVARMLPLVTRARRDGHLGLGKRFHCGVDQIQHGLQRADGMRMLKALASLLMDIVVIQVNVIKNGRCRIQMANDIQILRHHGGVCAEVSRVANGERGRRECSGGRGRGCRCGGGGGRWVEKGVEGLGEGVEERMVAVVDDGDGDRGENKREGEKAGGGGTGGGRVGSGDVGGGGRRGVGLVG